MDYIYNYRILLTVNLWLYFYDNTMVRPPTSFSFHPLLFQDYSVYTLYITTTAKGMDGDLGGTEGTILQKKVRWGRPMHPSPQDFEK